MAESDLKIATLTTAVVQLAAALVSTRRVLYSIMTHPTLLLDQSQREEFSKQFDEGAERLKKAMDEIEQLLAEMKG